MCLKTNFVNKSIFYFHFYFLKSGNGTLEWFGQVQVYLKVSFEYSGLHTLTGHDRNFMKFTHSCYFDFTTTAPFLSLYFCCISMQPHFILNDIIQQMGQPSQKMVAIFVSFRIVSTNNFTLIHCSLNSNFTEHCHCKFLFSECQDYHAC